MTDTKTITRSSFTSGTAFQVGGFSTNNSQFRLRTIGRGYFLEKSEKVLGTGQSLVVREFKVVWNNKTVNPSFRLLTTSKSVAMSKDAMYEYFDDKCTGDYFPNVVDEDTLSYKNNLSCRKAAWFKILDGSNEEELAVYFRKACIAIFSTEDREGGFYFEEEVVTLVDKLLDSEYTKSEESRDELFKSFHGLEKKIDRMRKKKGASRRLLTKICSLITLVLTECKIKGEESVDLIKEDTKEFKIKEIAKFGFNVALNDINIMMTVIKHSKDENVSVTGGTDVSIVE